MSRAQKFRFAFTIADGPNRNLTSGPFQVKVRGEDVYLFAEHMGETLKASFHADAAWRVAYTRDHAESDGSLVPAGHDRVMSEFEPTEFVDGGRIFFGIAFARGALRLLPIDGTHDHVAVNDRWDELTSVVLFMTEPGVGLGPTHQVAGGPLTLRSGRRVWITKQAQSIDPSEPHLPPPSAMLKQLVPGTHDVEAPGWLVVGLNFA